MAEGVGGVVVLGLKDEREVGGNGTLSLSANKTSFLSNIYSFVRKGSHISLKGRCRPRKKFPPKIYLTDRLTYGIL